MDDPSCSSAEHEKACRRKLSDTLELCEPSLKNDCPTWALQAWQGQPIVAAPRQVAGSHSYGSRQASSTVIAAAAPGRLRTFPLGSVRERDRLNQCVALEDPSRASPARSAPRRAVIRVPLTCSAVRGRP